MKRILSLLLTVLIFLSLTGCGIHDYAGFYYRRADYISEAQEPVIAKESREVTGHANDLTYLLSLYLMGPLDKKLQSPFPANTRLVSARMEDSTLTLQLSRQADDLTDSDYSLACACLTMTCMEITSATDVIIQCEDRITTMNRDMLVLQIPALPVPQTEEPK